MVPDKIPIVNNGSVLLKMVNGRQTDRQTLMNMVKDLDAGTRLIIVGDQARLPGKDFEAEADDYMILPGRVTEVWAFSPTC
jgi:hypothetical protein